MTEKEKMVLNNIRFEIKKDNYATNYTFYRDTATSQEGLIVFKYLWDNRIKEILNNHYGDKNGHRDKN
ncbi:hypothetical protein CWI39_1117p0010 [Hamiltosporidium magnivora]|uniref:Uncharacterized protein n=1 Tax=Hamiltosporidium magnivora TaxID=148818 RepID=A0A4Q9L4Z8_9MICR|nr:hypothetical protein CWI39_1117p0010 [Hamiltosporidium magnivora]